MIKITIEEFKNNLDMYLSFMPSEDIMIIKDGKHIGTFVPSKKDRIDNFFDEISGIDDRDSAKKSNDFGFGHFFRK